MKKVAILQSNYIPWKGYFDLINSVDEFVLYDDVQYTRRDWRNRNKVKTPNGVKWLSVPVKVKGKYFQSINETKIDGNEWMRIHFQSLCLNYKKSPYFNEICDIIKVIYMKTEIDYLSELNQMFIEIICDYLGITTKISKSSDYALTGDKSERLANLCEQTKADVYVSGPAAKVYLNEDCFCQKNIAVDWFNYPSYPEYPQLWGEFEHSVSVLDLLFNVGPNSARYIWGWKTA